MRQQDNHTTGMQLCSDNIGYEFEDSLVCEDLLPNDLVILPTSLKAHTSILLIHSQCKPFMGSTVAVYIYRYILSFKNLSLKLLLIRVPSVL